MTIFCSFGFSHDNSINFWSRFLSLKEFLLIRQIFHSLFLLPKIPVHLRVQSLPKLHFMMMKPIMRILKLFSCREWIQVTWLISLVFLFLNNFIKCIIFVFVLGWFYCFPVGLHFMNPIWLLMLGDVRIGIWGEAEIRVVIGAGIRLYCLPQVIVVCYLSTGFLVRLLLASIF